MPLPPDLSKPVFALFPEAADRIIMNRCPLCNDKVGSFKDEISMKEFSISGLCQNCQDNTFNKRNSTMKLEIDNSTYTLTEKVAEDLLAHLKNKLLDELGRHYTLLEEMEQKIEKKIADRMKFSRIDITLLEVYQIATTQLEVYRNQVPWPQGDWLNSMSLVGVKEFTAFISDQKIHLENRFKNVDSHLKNLDDSSWGASTAAQLQLIRMVTVTITNFLDSNVQGGKDEA